MSNLLCKHKSSLIILYLSLFDKWNWSSHSKCKTTTTIWTANFKYTHRKEWERQITSSMYMWAWLETSSLMITMTLGRLFGIVPTTPLHWVVITFASEILILKCEMTFSMFRNCYPNQQFLIQSSALDNLWRWKHPQQGHICVWYYW